MTLLTALSVTSTGHAATSLEADVAQDLLQRGADEDAWQVLAGSAAPEEGDAESWFIRGMVAKRTGRLPEARDAFRRVLASEPGADRARLELADVSYATGDIEAAREYLMAVKANNPPRRVGENIDQFLELLDSSARKNWQVFGAVGYTYDTNANAGPTTDSVLMFGLPFSLSNSARKNSDDALFLRVGFDHGARLAGDFVWQSSLMLTHTNYRRLDGLDATSLAASSGPSWQSGRTSFSLPLVGDQVQIGHAAPYYAYSLGVAPQIRHALGTSVVASVNSTLSRKWYYQQSDRDLNAWSLSPELEWKLGERHWLSAGASFGRENAVSDTYSNSLRGARLAYGGSLSESAAFSLSAQYFDTRYDAPEPAFSKSRHDFTTRIDASARFPIRQIASVLTLSVSYTENRSNLPLYAYDRTQASVSLGKSF